MQNAVWGYRWTDGSRLALFDNQNNYVLIEYDSDNHPVPVIRDEYSTSYSTEITYPKRRWKLPAVIDDIKYEYEISE